MKKIVELIKGLFGFAKAEVEEVVETVKEEAKAAEAKVEAKIDAEIAKVTAPAPRKPRKKKADQ